MKTIRTLLEWGSYPLWIYDEPIPPYEYGNLIDVEPPPELADYPELASNLIKIEEIYYNLFINTPIEFAYKDFDSLEEEQLYIELLHDTVEELRDKLGDKYNIIDDFTYNFAPDEPAKAWEEDGET